MAKGQDNEGVAKFMSEIDQERVWKYYEIRACLLKYADDDSEWKVGFLYVRLLDNKIAVQPYLPDLKRLKMVHEILPIDSLNDLLNLISTRQNVRIGGVGASLEFITTPLKYELYWNSHPFTEHFRVEDSCYGLSATGDYSTRLDDTLEFVR